MKARESEERVRFCDGCNAVVGWYAIHCESCGIRLKGRDGGDEDGARLDPDSLGGQLFKAHLRLIHRSRERAERLNKSVDRWTARVADLEARLPKASARAGLDQAGERLLDLEEEWGEIQRAFNRQSEVIEEDFNERQSEMEVDIELGPEHQAAVEEEVSALLELLEGSQESLVEAGRRLDLARARAKSGILGLGSSARGTLVLGVIALFLSLGGVSYGLFLARIPPLQLALSVGPAWLGLCLLFLNARAKSF